MVSKGLTDTLRYKDIYSYDKGHFPQSQLKQVISFYTTCAILERMIGGPIGVQ